MADSLKVAGCLAAAMLGVMAVPGVEGFYSFTATCWVAVILYVLRYAVRIPWSDLLKATTVLAAVLFFLLFVLGRDAQYVLTLVGGCILIQCWPFLAPRLAKFRAWLNGELPE